MFKHKRAERSWRPFFPLLYICIPFFSIVILSACNSDQAGNSLSRSIQAARFTPQATARLAARAKRADGGVIDLVSCTRGLSGSLSTARAGQVLIHDNGPVRHGEGQNARELIDYVEPAPSAPSSVPMRANATAGLLTAAYEQSGRPYKSGGQNPGAGFDAAGFTRWVYARRGISIPKTAQRQAAGGRHIAREDLRPGDLLVYRDSAAQGGFHVGIYTGKGNFLHAMAKSGVVTETDAFGPQFFPYFVGARRYYDDPKAAPLSDSEKMAAASSAVKTALSELGPEDQPERQAYSKPKKRNTEGRARRTGRQRKR